MKTSELIKELQEAMKCNGDQEVTIMIYGKRFPSVELNAEGNDLYIEAYIPDDKEEDLFIRQHVMYKDWTK